MYVWREGPKYVQGSYVGMMYVLAVPCCSGRNFDKFHLVSCVLKGKRRLLEKYAVDFKGKKMVHLRHFPKWRVIPSCVWLF